MKFHRSSYLGSDEVKVNGILLSDILAEHVLWNKSKGKKGKRAILEDADLTNLAINPENDISELFNIESGITGQQYLYEILTPKGPESIGKSPKGLDLSNIVIKNSILENVNLRYVIFDNGDFSGSSLRGATLTDSSFIKASFEKTNLVDAKMSGAKCDHANFYLADIREAWLRDANLSFASMRQMVANCVLFRGANCWKTDFSDSDLSGSVFLSGWLEHSIFRNCNLQETNFDDAKVDKVDFTNADLRGSSITPEQLKSARSYKNAKVLDYSNLPIKSPSVFLSYSWKDYPAVAAVDFWLRKQELEVYRDERNFMAGDSLIGSIQDYIERAEVIVVFVSKNSKGRPYPKMELELARMLEIENDEKKQLIYFCLDDTIIDSLQKVKITIQAYQMTFDEACAKLWHAITRTKEPPKDVDLARFMKAGKEWTKTS